MIIPGENKAILSGLEGSSKANRALQNGEKPAQNVTSE
jgi:hypothetical protein